MIQYLLSKLKATKLAIGNVCLDFLDKPALRLDAVKVSHQQHF